MKFPEYVTIREEFLKFWKVGLGLAHCCRGN